MEPTETPILQIFTTLPSSGNAVMIERTATFGDLLIAALVLALALLIILRIALAITGQTESWK